MTETVTEKEKVPFCACLKHEMKVATKWYVTAIIWLLVIAVVSSVILTIGSLGFGYAIKQFESALLVATIVWCVAYGVVMIVAGVVGNTWASLSAYHGYIFIGCVIISPPVLYSLAVCTLRRLPKIADNVGVEFIATGIVGTAISLAMCCIVDAAIAVVNISSEAIAIRYGSAYTPIPLVPIGIFIFTSILITLALFLLVDRNATLLEIGNNDY